MDYWEISAELWQREIRSYRCSGWRPQEEAGEHIYEEQLADETGADLQRELVSLPVAFQEVKQLWNGK